MTRLEIACVVGARPNFMKMAPILRAFAEVPEVRTTLIHTGQHYDEALSQVFFRQLGMPKPDIDLGVGSGSQAVQTARVLERFEAALLAGPDGGGRYGRVIVVGDVNSTLAATLAAVKLNIPVAHVEAGLRSFDRTMPEEINRLMTDAVSDLLLVSEPSGVENLMREGHSTDRVHLVGNVMIDTLRDALPRLDSDAVLQQCGVESGRYGVVTLHRPANVDSPETLRQILHVLAEASQRLPLLFPVHPRTKGRIDEFGLAELLSRHPDLRVMEPQGYLEFLALTSNARVIVTDSGGLQEESTALGIPCLTMRPNTERPITVAEGTSTLIGSDAELLRQHFEQVLDGTYQLGRCPEIWDGNSAKRIAGVICRAHGLTELPVATT